MENMHGKEFVFFGNIELIFDDEDEYDSDELSKFLDSLDDSDEISEDDFEELMSLLDEQLEAYENMNIYDADHFVQASKESDRPEAESEDAKIWREIAESLERENAVLNKFHNLLLIQLMSNGTLGLLGTRGMWN